MSERSIVFDIAAKLATEKFADAEPVAYFPGCANCAGQCKGHPVTKKDNMEALVESCRWATETLCRAASAKDRQSDQLAAENRQMYEALTRIATGFEHGAHWCAEQAADCLDAVSGAK